MLRPMQRTPDERFVDLPDFPYEPHYRDWDGMRLAHLDEGAGDTILLLHGEPTWSYLWRKTIPSLVAAGHRCIAPDLPGFGRSDKPDDDWYTYDRLVASIVSLLEDLDLTDVTLVVHDWGGPIGLRVATTEVPDRIVPHRHHGLRAVHRPPEHGRGVADGFAPSSRPNRTCRSGCWSTAAAPPNCHLRSSRRTRRRSRPSTTRAALAGCRR